ncbi:MAG: type II secretion system secretin GspD [Betaproteobacteria bacterium]|nr:type II secretion system secretin GspD [Betaproteobacteria bacterium]
MKPNLLRIGIVWLAVTASFGQAWAADEGEAPARAQNKARVAQAAPSGAKAPAAAAQERPGAAGVPAAPTPQPGARAARPAGGPDVVTLNFVNADIEGVIRVVSEITGKNFVIDPRVKGAVNIISARPIPKALVYEVFLSAMRLQGYAAVEDRGAVRIVPEVDAKLQPSRTVGPDEKPRASGDQMQTQVFTLTYESAVQMVPILRPLIAANNVITAHAGANSLIISDYASNLRRIEKILDAIDQPSGTDPIVIPLRYASALDVAQTVTRLLADTVAGQAGAAADQRQRVSVVGDARSNSIFARSDNPSRIPRLRSLVAMLDTPTSAAGNIHVVYLKNAEAVKVAEVLRAIYSGETAAPRPAAPLAAPSAPGAAPQPAARPAAPATPGIIQADPATNSVIITAPDPIYNNLRAVLERLDVRRAQVYVEALIAEVTANKAAEFGIQWQSLGGLGATDTSARVFGGTNFGNASQNIIGVAVNPGVVGRGINIGVIKGRVNIPGIGEILNLGALVRALETDNNANILSTPTLLTLDNEEARIVIGQNVPFITGQFTSAAGATTVTPFQTIERRDVGLSLRIKPQISQGGAVRLQIYQEVSSIQDATNAAGVITNKRSVESNVLVDDGQIVVIGGLIQDTVNDGVEKVPGLGDLPLIGGLFRFNTRSRLKTNLMVFLRPSVVRDAKGADPMTSDRYNYIVGEQDSVKPAPSAVLPEIPVPTLPPKAPAPASAPKPQ